MKFKLLAILVTVTIMVGAGFYWTAATLFKEDKLAYIYSHAQQEALNIDNSVQELVFDLENLFVTFINQKTFPEEYVRFLTQKFGILSVELDKNDETVFSYGKTDARIPMERKNGLRIVKDKELDGVFHLAMTKTATSGRYEVYYKLQHPQFHSAIRENSNFKASLFDENGKLFLSNNNLGESVFRPADAERLKAQKVKAMTFNRSLGEKNYLSSLTSISIGEQKYYLILLQDKKVALSAIENFKVKSLLMITFIISLAGMTGVFLGGRLTSNLTFLKEAAQRWSREEFDRKVVLSSNDEVGVLAGAFDSMRINIKELLEEIREHNLFLEDKVKERTAELHQALQLQKAMVDNLDQGFFMFKNGGRLLPVFSKASKRMFPTIGNESTFGQVLSPDQAQRNELNDFCDLMLSRELPFEDVACLAPKELVSANERIIHLNYTPVLDENGLIEFVVVVASDKTDEIQALKEIKREKEHAKAILHFVKQKQRFISLLENYKTKKDEFIAGKKSLLDLKIYIHTLKGNVGVYHLGELAEFLHQEENRLESVSKLDQVNLKRLFAEADKLFNRELEKYGAMLGFSNLENLKRTKEINLEDIEFFRQKIHSKAEMTQIKSQFEETFVFEEVKTLLPDFKQETQAIAQKLDKKVDSLKIWGGDIKVPGIWEEVLVNLSHLIRNSLDHGIESPEERKNKGKSQKGSISLEFTSDAQSFKIIFTDDGRGIPLEKIRKKRGLPESAPDKVVLSALFEEGMSTSKQLSQISGRGIGLGSLKEVVTRLNGEIEIQTEESVGCVFVITLPWKTKNHLKLAV
ncbi:MAG: ATP-binding protein [Bacteriovoracaceae bacterium]